MGFTEGFHIDVMKPPFVAANALARELNESESFGRRAPAKTVPTATEPDVDVPTDGSHEMIHLRGLCEAYVCASEADLVPAHFVGVMGNIKLKPAGCDVTGKISLVVSVADPSRELRNVAYDEEVRV